MWSSSTRRTTTGTAACPRPRRKGFAPATGSFYDICAGKQVYLLTATPVNNHLTDFQHLIELFAQRLDSATSSLRLGIHHVAAHFQLLETRSPDPAGPSEANAR